jgi:hypothetical protein
MIFLLNNLYARVDKATNTKVTGKLKKAIARGNFSAARV